jgi:hypothetical protein
MVSNKIISYSKTLNAKFVNHIETTSNLCLYKSHFLNIPNSIIFTNANEVTLINCSRDGINSLLTPKVFPNLTSINYMSMHPGDYDIYKRFNRCVKWSFPDVSYNFYISMMAIGVGRKDSSLIKKYIILKKMIDGTDMFDISYEMDLNIPGFGITNGNWYKLQFDEYINTKKSNTLHVDQESEELSLQRDTVKQELNAFCYNPWTI